MLENGLQFEKSLFFQLNGSESAFLDNFFYLYSYKWTWLLFYLCFLFIFCYKKNLKEIVCILLALGLVVLLCDQIASGFCKPFFHRFRPTHHPDFGDQVKTVMGYRGGLYGFISSHASNAFGFAVFTLLIFRNRIYTGMIFLFALLTIYSRVYLGVHFISDVVAGALVGSLIGYSVYRLYQFGRYKWVKVEKNDTKSGFSQWKSNFLCGIFGVHLTFLLLFSNQLVKILFQE
ncbi:MAG: phosphatase PAP2 family protein [Dysgonamonadaceae bacterium]|jgi:undecaprenyl-diphosphatase|nr:phosphatase PAP2 family protein [Dysgonamonadaceae bacterium]